MKACISEISFGSATKQLSVPESSVNYILEEKAKEDVATIPGRSRKTKNTL